MRIHPVQNYNNNQKTAFKSQVRLHYSDARATDGSFLKDRIIKGIKQLQQNGDDNRVFLELYKGSVYPRILINVVKKAGEKLFVGTASNAWGKSPTDIYEEAIKDMKPTEDNPLYFGLNKVHLPFYALKEAGQYQQYREQLLNLEKTVKEGDSVSITPYFGWSNIWVDVVRKIGEIYTHGWESIDALYYEFCEHPFASGYERAIKDDMEPSEEYNNNPLYYEL